MRQRLTVRKNGSFDLPEWSRLMHYDYCLLRCEGRNQTTRRRAYRRLEKIKLELVESGVPQNHVVAVARYMSTYSYAAGSRMIEVLNEPYHQLVLDFRS